MIPLSFRLTGILSVPLLLPLFRLLISVKFFRRLYLQTQLSWTYFLVVFDCTAIRIRYFFRSLLISFESHQFFNGDGVDLLRLFLLRN